MNQLGSWRDKHDPLSGIMPGRVSFGDTEFTVLLLLFIYLKYVINRMFIKPRYDTSCFARFKILYSKVKHQPVGLVAELCFKTSALWRWRQEDIQGQPQPRSAFQTILL